MFFFEGIYFLLDSVNSEKDDWDFSSMGPLFGVAIGIAIGTANKSIGAALGAGIGMFIGTIIEFVSVNTKK